MVSPSFLRCFHLYEFRRCNRMEGTESVRPSRFFLLSNKIWVNYAEIKYGTFITERYVSGCQAFPSTFDFQQYRRPLLIAFTIARPCAH